MRKMKTFSVIIIFIAVFVAVLLLVFLPKNQIGKQQTKGDYEYIPYESHSVLVKYKGTDDVVNIPEVFNAKPVTMIADSAFEGNQTIREVSIPSSVERIGKKAFKDCTSLEKISLPFEINYIDKYAFSNCESLEELDIPKDESRKNLMIAGWAFEKCTNLKKVYLGDGLEVSLEEEVFIDCVNLAEVSGNHNIYMFDSSFENTKVMNNREDADFFCIDNCLIQYLGKDRDVVLPERIDEICKYAFNYGVIHKGIDSIHIPESVTYLDLDYDISYTSNPEKKVKLYFGNPTELNVSEETNAADNFIFVAPEDSIVIKYAIDNGIEYLIED